MSAKDVVLRGLISPVKGLMEEARVVLERGITDPSPAAQDMLDHISRFRGKQMRGALLLLSALPPLLLLSSQVCRGVPSQGGALPHPHRPYPGTRPACRCCYALPL